MSGSLAYYFIQQKLKFIKKTYKHDAGHNHGVHSCGYAHKDSLVTCIILAATQPKFYTRHKIINTPWIFDSEKAKNLPLSRLCIPAHTLVHTIIDPSCFDVRAMVHAFFITLTCLLRHDKVSKNVLMLWNLHLKCVQYVHSYSHLDWIQNCCCQSLCGIICLCQWNQSMIFKIKNSASSDGYCVRSQHGAGKWVVWHVTPWLLGFDQISCVNIALEDAQYFTLTEFDNKTLESNTISWWFFPWHGVTVLEQQLISRMHPGHWQLY